MAWARTLRLIELLQSIFITRTNLFFRIGWAIRFIIFRIFIFITRTNNLYWILWALGGEYQFIFLNILILIRAWTRRFDLIIFPSFTVFSFRCRIIITTTMRREFHFFILLSLLFGAWTLRLIDLLFRISLTEFARIRCRFTIRFIIHFFFALLILAWAWFFNLFFFIAFTVSYRFWFRNNIIYTIRRE